MKNKLAKAGLCMLAAGLLFTSSVYATEIHSEHTNTTESSVFWRKKDKEAAPDTENPEASPLPSPEANPSNAPTVSPKDAQKEIPDASPHKAAPKESSEVTPTENPKEVAPKETPKETSLASQHAPGDTQKQNPTPDPSPQPTPNPTPQPNNSQPEKHHQNNHKTNATDQNHSNYMSDVSEELQKVLAKRPGIKLDADAYIVQHDNALWLVMGNIRAKLDILIYVDQKHIAEAGFDGTNAIPLYK